VENTFHFVIKLHYKVLKLMKFFTIKKFSTAMTPVIFHKFKSPMHQKYFHLLWSYHGITLYKYTHLRHYLPVPQTARKLLLVMEKLSEYVMWLAHQVPLSGIEISVLQVITYNRPQLPPDPGVLISTSSSSI
jgi:hypothetical protein